MERVSELVIVPAGPADAAALAAVHVATWRETYRGILPAAQLAAMDARLHARRWRAQLTRPGQGEVVLVAEGPLGLVGYCAGSSNGDTAEIATLYVRVAAQGRGIGRRLITSAARTFEARGAKRLMLGVLGENRNARAFYEHLGGRRAGERPVRGWGARLEELIYQWEDITALSRR